LFSVSRKQPNQGVQLTPLARLVGWARSTRQNAPACWQHDNAQPSAVAGNPTPVEIYGSAARALPGSCLCSPSSTLPTPASGAADACPFGGSLQNWRFMLYNGNKGNKARG